MIYYFIVNPHSKTDQGLHIWRSLKLILEQSNIRFKAYDTQHPGHCAEIVRTLTTAPKEPITLVILGGDGTLNEAVNGIQSFENVTLAYIPTGSSNDFARGMKFSGTPKEQLESILSRQHECSLDYGSVQTEGLSEQRFLVSGGTGFDAAVTDEALHSPIKTFLNRLRMGKLTYALIAVKQLFSLNIQNADIQLDTGESLHYDQLYFVSCHNLPYEGGGFLFTPDADPCDGFLDLCIIHDMPRLKALSLLPTAFWGKHTVFKGVDLYRCKEMTITFPKPSPVHTDGETYHPQSNVTVRCHKNKIHFVY